VEFKVNHAKLVQFENEYNNRTTEENMDTSSCGGPSGGNLDLRQKKKLERDNKRLAEQNMRLEEETNSLARQLVERQVSLMQMVEKSNEEKGTLQKEITSLKASLQREKVHISVFSTFFLNLW